MKPRKNVEQTAIRAPSSSSIEVKEFTEEKPEINMQHHFKIWFQMHNTEWASDRNQSRLIRHKKKNPEGTLYLVGDNSLLTATAQQERDAFCKKYDIHYLDLKDLEAMVRNNVDLNEKEKEIDLALLKLAIFELERFKENPRPYRLAIVSDLLRWISSLLRLGIYSDLDTEIELKAGAPQKINRELLMPCKWNFELFGVQYPIFINNNFVACTKKSKLADYIRAQLVERGGF